MTDLKEKNIGQRRWCASKNVVSSSNVHSTHGRLIWTLSSWLLRNKFWAKLFDKAVCENLVFRHASTVQLENHNQTTNGQIKIQCKQIHLKAKWTRTLYTFSDRNRWTVMCMGQNKAELSNKDGTMFSKFIKKNFLFLFREVNI